MVAASSESDAAPDGEVREAAGVSSILGGESVHSLTDLWVVAGELERSAGLAATNPVSAVDLRGAARLGRGRSKGSLTVVLCLLLRLECSARPSKTGTMSNSLPS